MFTDDKHMISTFNYRIECSHTIAYNYGLEITFILNNAKEEPLKSWIYSVNHYNGFDANLRVFVYFNGKYLRENRLYNMYVSESNNLVCSIYTLNPDTTIETTNNILHRFFDNKDNVNYEIKLVDLNKCPIGKEHCLELFCYN